MFTLNAKEEKDRFEWVRKHNKVCKDSRLTYYFNPTGIGMGFKVSCTCGSQADLTDYDSW